ncbi:hypothetical protein BH11PSE2_BH11PSE2_14600 [soil metagenome]
MPMARRETRGLTETEIAALSPGLHAALTVAGARPRIIARSALGARISALWRRDVPVLTWGQSIYWPGALTDFSNTGHNMGVLQHELQHVLEFTTGKLTHLGYGLNPRNWSYAYAPTREWSAYGAEQRAQIVQDLWLTERGLGPSLAPLDWYRGVIPWA